jgi:pimeloyl-ACP methyl ester carboxylesterase
MTLIDANGVKVNITDSGAPAGNASAPTVVFGHGLLFSGHMFEAQIERLRSTYRCVTIDWRGQGKTPATEDGYDMDTLSLDAAAVIEGLGVGPVHYVGLSMGGFVGLRLAARRPELLRSLILLDTSADPEDPAMAKQDRLLCKVYRVVGIRPLSGKVGKLMFGPTFLADPASKPDLERWKAGVAAVERPGMVKAILGVVDRLPVTAELDAISLPTLIVVGEDDAATPVARSEAIAAGIKGSVLKKVKDCGHSSTVEQPEILADLIEEFLTAQDKGDSID